MESEVSTGGAAYALSRSAPAAALPTAVRSIKAPPCALVSLQGGARSSTASRDYAHAGHATHARHAFCCSSA
jgi:hypothetical protein